MSSSGQDIETSSVDSPQSHCESPYSSPSQQVPHLAFTLTTLNMSTACQPFLRIVEQPQDHFRFRYKSEMVGTHGCLLGKSQNSSRNKTHPTVELVNYPGRAVIRCRLAQDKNSGEHPHKLLEEEQDRDVSYEVPEQGSYKVGFGGMGIIHTAKKDVPGLLYTKYAQMNTQMSLKELRAHCESEAKKINLNIVRLRFSAHDINTDAEICPPVFSDPIHNMKSASTNDLKICRISKTIGRPMGGDDVFIFVEKVNKKNIKIRFFELAPTGEEVWHAYAHFLESDVHHQYAIAFSTPQYRDPYTSSDVTVYFELQRPQDGRTSDPKEFKYKAEVACKLQNKKRKANSSYSSINSNSSSMKSDVPATVMLQACNGAFDGSHDVDMAATTIQSIPQLPIGNNSPHSDLGDALLLNLSANTSPAERHFYNDNPVLAQCNVPMHSLPDFNSTELKQILEHNSDMTAEEKMRFSEADWSKYLESFGSLPEETNSMSFIRDSLIPDSGVNKGGATQSTNKASNSSQMAVETQADVDKFKLNIFDKIKGQEKPFYKAEDGQEVKKLVVELVELMRKTPLKKNVIRIKLERLVEKRLSNGDTFLHMSLNSNRPSFEYIVKMAHHLGMTHLLNLQNNSLQTILHLAIVAEEPTLVAFLISKGCDPMLEDEHGNKAIHYAVMCREDASCLDSLLQAIRRHGVPHDINTSIGDKHITALHLAVTYKSVAKTQCLLKHGASCSVTDSDGRTPLHVAAKMNYRLVMAKLLDYVPNHVIEAVDGRGYTALQILCDCSVQEDTVEMVKMLLDKKADPRAHRPQSAWHLARNKPRLREVMQPFIGDDVMDEDDIKSEPDDDIKSEPEVDSGDEYVEAEMCLPELSSYISELSTAMDASGAWRALAAKLSLDSMSSWFQNTANPSRTLLNFLKQSDSDITSRSLATTLEELGEREAANIIRKYID
ncbi:nuclear factor NF-kappa-B p105 subunit [Plodia interpunctella]|uniref:nuclear factor NF-kappa-B p105 subunit n=1 Tax=Plodia interpunctella TaxID=58824 RepID=UPI002367FCB3|nr:nuclear factor NF-kappa-B p105 subunit [Plodia interpunctella]